MKTLGVKSKEVVTTAIAAVAGGRTGIERARKTGSLTTKRKIKTTVVTG